MKWFQLTIACADKRKYPVFIEAIDMAEALEMYQRNAANIIKQAQLPDKGVVIQCRICFHVFESGSFQSEHQSPEG